jgi:hypothetical protein
MRCPETAFFVASSQAAAVVANQIHHLLDGVFRSLQLPLIHAIKQSGQAADMFSEVRFIHGPMVLAVVLSG